MKAFMADMQKWQEKLGSDKDMKEYGYADVTHAVQPYGPAA